LPGPGPLHEIVTREKVHRAWSSRTSSLKRILEFGEEQTL